MLIAPTLMPLFGSLSWAALALEGPPPLGITPVSQTMRGGCHVSLNMKQINTYLRQTCLKTFVLNMCACVYKSSTLALTWEKALCQVIFYISD